MPGGEALKIHVKFQQYPLVSAVGQQYYMSNVIGPFCVPLVSLLSLSKNDVAIKITIRLVINHYWILFKW
jgi:hypothetical protein